MVYENTRYTYVSVSYGRFMKILGISVFHMDGL
jgi:hypothetical protein